VAPVEDDSKLVSMPLRRMADFPIVVISPLHSEPLVRDCQFYFMYLQRGGRATQSAARLLPSKHLRSCNCSDGPRCICTRCDVASKRRKLVTSDFNNHRG